MPFWSALLLPVIHFFSNTAADDTIIYDYSPYSNGDARRMTCYSLTNDTQVIPLILSDATGTSVAAFQFYLFGNSQDLSLTCNGAQSPHFSFTDTLTRRFEYVLEYANGIYTMSITTDKMSGTACTLSSSTPIGNINTITIAYPSTSQCDPLQCLVL